MLYRENLSAIHDAGFGALAQSASGFLVDTLVGRGLDRGRVVDLGCGRGILAKEMSKRGYRILGIDLSKPMLALARKRVPAAEFHRASCFSTAIPPCVAVAATGECFSYALVRRSDDASLSKLFRRIHRALVPRGVFLFDMATPSRSVASFHRETQDWAVIVDGDVDRKRKILTRRITSFVREGDRFRRQREVHRLRLVPRERVEHLLRSAGFRVRTQGGYGTFRFPKGITGYLCFK